MAARLRTDFWIAALRRRVEAAGAFVSIGRRGASEAGTIFIAVNRGGGAGGIDLYGPAPQSIFEDERPSERMFMQVASDLSPADLQTRMEREVRFDPDLWQIDIDDREGRCFVDLAAEETPGFTSR